MQHIVPLASCIGSQPFGDYETCKARVLGQTMRLSSEQVEKVTQIHMTGVVVWHAVSLVLGTPCNCAACDPRER
jgi:hypothetical protein